MAFAIDDLSSVIAHWSADQITGLSNGDPVDSLPDSISAWNMVGSGTARPLYRPVSAINSLPAIEFDGTNDLIQTAATRVVAGNPLTVVTVVRLDALKNFQPMLQLTASSGLPANPSDFNSWAYNNGDLLARSGSPFVIVTSAISTATAIVVQSIDTINGILGGAVNEVFQRPSSSVGNAAVFPTGAKFASFGAVNLAGGYFDGLLAEVVLINDDRLLTSRYHVVGVLAHKYGITLPAAHPFAAAAPTTGPSSGGSTVIVIED